ncbi:hypothetical protein DER46DRAFT_591341 [Fusarium sp. MPI-SDFR-AT-0072]|nr:hypothetical protein DER46DRAFT_591341 [Fusarium sp. MPI-SDFR-AT-0072]
MDAQLFFPFLFFLRPLKLYCSCPPPPLLSGGSLLIHDTQYLTYQHRQSGYSVGAGEHMARHLSAFVVSCCVILNGWELKRYRLWKKASPNNSMLCIRF